MSVRKVLFSLDKTRSGIISILMQLMEKISQVTDMDAYRVQ